MTIEKTIYQAMITGSRFGRLSDLMYMVAGKRKTKITDRGLLPLSNAIDDLFNILPRMDADTIQEAGWMADRLRADIFSKDISHCDTVKDSDFIRAAQEIRAFLKAH